jgi:hypothetical protein
MRGTPRHCCLQGGVNGRGGGGGGEWKGWRGRGIMVSSMFYFAFGVVFVHVEMMRGVVQCNAGACTRRGGVTVRSTERHFI